MENLTQTETFFHHKDGIGVPVAKPVISGFVHLFGPTHLSKRTIEKALEDLPQHTFEKCGTLETSWTFETSGTFEIETSNTFETFGTFETSGTLETSGTFETYCTAVFVAALVSAVASLWPPPSLTTAPPSSVFRRLRL